VTATFKHFISLVDLSVIPGMSAKRYDAGVPRHSHFTPSGLERATPWQGTNTGILVKKLFYEPTYGSAQCSTFLRSSLVLNKFLSYPNSLTLKNACHFRSRCRCFDWLRPGPLPSQLPGWPWCLRR
jgi:hypothetical protein